MTTKTTTLEAPAANVIGGPELAKRIAKKTGVTPKQAGEILEATWGTISETLATGAEVRLIGFGTWSTQETTERNGINPQTRKSIVIPASTKVRFSPGKTLAEAVAKK